VSDLLPVRFSHLRAYGKSPMHGHAARTAPERKPTAAMQLGSAVHALYSGSKDVVAYPGKVRRGAEWETFAADFADSIILTGAEFSKAEAMVEALHACEVAQPYLQGEREQTILFNWNGLPCRATPDVRGATYLTELKTSVSSDPNHFPWHARRMHYPAQMAMQALACPEARDLYIVCVEAAYPHPVIVYHIEPQAWEWGSKLLVLWAERLKTCEESGAYPPYTDAVVPLDMPDEDVALEFPEEGEE